MRLDKVKYLSRINLFQQLNEAELLQLEPATPIHPVKKGTIVASPHGDRQLLFLIKSGTVRLYKISAGGKELTVDLLGAGHLFGEVGSFATGSKNMYAQTLTDAVICTIDKAQFEQLMTEKPRLALKFIEIVATRLKEVEEMLEHMAYGSVRKRLLFLLSKLSEKFGAGVPAAEGYHDEGEGEWIQLEVKLTHQELASMMGSIRETVTEQLSELASEGIVDKKGLRSRIRIHPGRLKHALDRC